MVWRASVKGRLEQKGQNVCQPVDRQANREAQSGERQDRNLNEFGRHLALAHSLIDPLQDIWVEVSFSALLTDISEEIFDKKNPSLPAM